MNSLDHAIQVANRWLSTHGLGAGEVQLLSLILACVGVMLCLTLLTRVRALSPSSATAETQERLSVGLSDLRKALDARTQLLEDSLKRLEKRLGELEKIPPPVSEELKKKPLELKGLAIPAEADANTREQSFSQFRLPSEGPVPSKAEGPVPRSVEEPVPSKAVVPLPRSVEGPVPSVVEGSLTEKIEAETPQRTSVFSGLKKTRDAFFTRLSQVLGKQQEIGESLYSELEELLISSDLGVRTTAGLLDGLKASAAAKEIASSEDCRSYLKNRILGILQASVPPEIVAEKQAGKPLVILVVGVNGVGKTTTIGKLASRFASSGKKVLLGAADTFRAAAGEQIEVWAERAEVEVLRAAENAKPATVAYEAVHKAQAGNMDVVLIDTAGRLHTRINLMNELDSVISIVAREQPGAPHETLLIVDATTGQNALEQAKEFHARAKLTGIIVTKLDGTPKGGIVVAIRNELGLPIRYIGVGETAADLKPFSAAEFVDALFAEGDAEAFTASQPKASVRAVRRRGNEMGVS